MNDASQEVWFYTHEGEKIGPVNFASLRVKVSEGALNPRLDMVWTQGMADWKPAGEIEGLFERRAAPEPPAALAPPADPYTPPDKETAEELMGKEQDWPGARRRSYLIAILIFPTLWYIGFGVASGFLITRFGPEIMRVVTLGAQFVPVIVLLYFGLRRLTNLGMSRWWYLGHFVPILNFWVGYRCFACPGGYAFHKKLDGVGIFLAIVYWLLMALVICAVVVIIALLTGSIGSHELQQQVQDAIRNWNDAIRSASQPKS